VLATAPAHGSLTLGPDGSLDYTPAAGFQGTDSFTFQASDGVSLSSPATVTIEVGALPVAHGDSYTVVHDRTLTVPAPGVLANDTDPAGLPGRVVFAVPPSHGNLTINADGSFVYTPAPHYSGPDSFTYQVNDGTSASNLATVTLTVANTPPVAADKNYSVDENQGLNVAAPGLLSGSSDADGDSLKAILVAAPTHGLVLVNLDGSFSYSPAVRYTGADSFSYRLGDGASASNVATVAITLNPHNSPPQLSLTNLDVVVAENGSITTPLPISDADGDALQLLLVGPPEHGTVSFSTAGPPRVAG
jgi:hypothetical protein